MVRANKEWRGKKLNPINDEKNLMPFLLLRTFWNIVLMDEALCCRQRSLFSYMGTAISESLHDQCWIYHFSWQCS